MALRYAFIPSDPGTTHGAAPSYSKARFGPPCGKRGLRTLPDFIVLVDDGPGPDGPLHLIAEIKGYRREDAKERKSTMDTYWVPGVSYLKTYGRWASTEFTEVYQIEGDFKAKVESEFNKVIAQATHQ